MDYTDYARSHKLRVAARVHFMEGDICVKYTVCFCKHKDETRALAGVTSFTLKVWVFVRNRSYWTMV